MLLEKPFNDDEQPINSGINRRFFIKAGLGACVGLILPQSAYANYTKNTKKTGIRQISFHNLHTGEKVKAVYWEKGRYISGALREIDNVLRDHRTGKRHAIDVRLLDMVQLLHRMLGAKKEFQVVSGYRSPETNRLLASQQHGVAKHSLHMQGKAIDIRLPEFSLSDVRKAALSMQVGGVGYYPGSNFIHLDSGQVRNW